MENNMLALDEKNKKIFYTLILIGIIAFGLFLRTYNIENTPPGIYPDEAVNGEDALRAINTGDWRWFYPANQGREGLFINLIAICFKLFGASILTLKLPGIIFGTFTIWGTYLLAKEIFKKELLALISAFLIAVSFWPLNFSRISFRANMLPFILVFSFYFLWKGMRSQKIWPFIWGGLFFGLGMHSYIAFRIAPAILLVALLSFWINEKNFWKNNWKQFTIFIFSFFLVASPMFYTFYIHPEYFVSRADSISVFSPTLNHGRLTQTILESFSFSLLKYNFVGDMNWRHNFPPYPLLDLFTGLAFLVGIGYSISKAIKSILLRFKNKLSNRKMSIYLFLLIWFLAMLAPEFLTAEGLPHALRSIGTIPVVMLFSALGFEYVLRRSEKEHSPTFQKITLSIMIFIFLFIGIFNSLKYHIFWPAKEKTELSFNKNLTDISKFIQTLPKEKEKFVITSYSTLAKLPIQIFTQKYNVIFLYPNELGKIAPKNSDDFIVFFTENNQPAINQIKDRFPDLNFQEISTTPGSVYYVLK
jgi:4-amino-4-deoxy-L-arabinose transferase-like glycosyltransferase